MQNHASTIKGLSIATIVFGALGILGAVLLFAVMSLTGTMLLNLGPDAVTSAHASGAVHGMEYSYDIDDQQALALASVMVSSVGGAISLWVLICHGVILVSGIIGLRGYNKPDKLGGVFGWAIAGAVLSFFGGGLVTLVLQIIVAVFANKDKQLYATAAMPGQPVA